jgi:hypothetical protein
VHQDGAVAEFVERALEGFGLGDVEPFDVLAPLAVEPGEGGFEFAEVAFEGLPAGGQLRFVLAPARLLGSGQRFVAGLALEFLEAAAGAGELAGEGVELPGETGLEAGQAGLRGARVGRRVAADEFEQFLFLEHRGDLLRFGEASGVDQPAGEAAVVRLVFLQESFLEILVEAGEVGAQRLETVDRLLAVEDRDGWLVEAGVQLGEVALRHREFDGALAVAGEDRQRALFERQRLVVAAHGLVQPRQVVEREGGARMLGAEGLFADRQRALVERQRLVGAAHGLVQRREVVERGRGVRMLGAKSLERWRRG